MKVRLGIKVTAYVGGVVLAYECFKPKPPLPSAAERCCTFGTLAPTYDAEVEQDEATSGILELRREIAAHAKGKVLEVAGGTGRNLAFYTEAVRELLVIDASAEMLKVGAGKVTKLRAEGKAAGLSAVTLAVGDAVRSLPCCNRVSRLQPHVTQAAHSPTQPSCKPTCPGGVALRERAVRHGARLVRPLLVRAASGGAGGDDARGQAEW